MTGRTPRVACLALAFVVGYVLFQTDLLFRSNRSEGELQKEQIQSAHNGSSALLADVYAEASETSYAAPRRLDGKLIYYMHVHKSGGTTLREIARFNEQRMSKNGLPMWEESGGADWGCCGHDDTLEGFREWAKSTAYDYLAPEDVMKTTIDTEHYRYLISLRDAKDRYISHHKHSMRKDVRKIPAFSEWMSFQEDNFHFRHICGCTAGKYKLARERWKYTIDRLLKFDSILFVEDYERGLQKLARKLQWKLPATRWENAAQSTEQQYNASGGYVWDPRETALDDALYAVAARIDQGLEPYTAISEELQARLDDYFDSPGSNMSDAVRLVKELEEFCESDALSLEGLTEKIASIPRNADALDTSSFVHRACGNERVTMDIVQYILEEFPDAEAMASDYSYNTIYHSREKAAYPIHFACMNERCADSIIELLMQKNPTALSHLGILGEYGVETGDFDTRYEGDPVEGTPLHYYLARTRGGNIELDMVKKLVEACPEALTMADHDSNYTPLHSHVCNLGIDGDIVRYLIETEPSLLQLECGYHMIPLHLACAHRGTGPGVIELLLSAWPEAIYRRDNMGELPIHTLCQNRELDDVASLEIYDILMERDPQLLRDAETDEGRLPLHFAVRSKSLEFCKVLIDAYPESIDTPDGSLFHCACAGRHLDTVKYLLEHCPGDLFRIPRWRYLPIHTAVESGTVEIVKYLLLKDPEGATKFTTERQRLPLHLACFYAHFETVQVLFNQHPWAIATRDFEGNTPVDLAKKRRSSEAVVGFLEAQLAYCRLSQRTLDLITLDNNGWLPLHHALRDNASLGAIKMLLSGNSSALRIADGKLAFPLHIACEFSSAEVVKYLLEVDKSWLNHCDSDGNSTLHYACRGGNCNVVNYLLQRRVPSVSRTNTENKLPVQLLCEARVEKGEESSPLYIDTIWRLLLAYPETVMQRNTRM